MKQMTKNWQGLEQLGNDIKEIDNHISNVAEETATDLIEGGTVDNAKPIYCHPVTIQLGNAKVNGRIAMLIFNNTPTAFTKESLKTYFDNLSSAMGVTIRFLSAGGIYDKVNSNFIVTSYLFKLTDSSYGFTGIKTDGTGTDVYGTFDELFEYAVINDGVNKIN